MSKNALIEGSVLPFSAPNLDTDQIMPKQFLRGIDKKGLDRGVFHDMRFDGQGQPRPDFVMNDPKYVGTSIILAGANFGCGSSREHAVWGLKQYGIRAVISSGFGEIFYSNSMNNGLMLCTVSEKDLQRLFAEEAAAGEPLKLTIDVENLKVISAGGSAPFALSDRHRRMFLEGLDMLGASLQHLDAIKQFAQDWHHAHLWLKDVASTARNRLNRD